MGIDATTELPVRAHAGSGVSAAGSQGFRQFGHGLRADFMFDPEWRNLNHG